jgi:signal transduction histidine kinase/CheY-like chemotaxis protein
VTLTRRAGDVQRLSLEVVNQRIVELTDRFVPRGLDAAARTRAQFFAGAQLLAIPFLLVSSLAYALGGLWGQVVVCVSMVLVSATALLWSRRSATIVGPTRLSLLGATLMFSSATLAQTPADVTNVCFLAVIPLLASFTLGRREALVWVGLELLFGALALVLAALGYTLPTVDPTPWLTQGFNFAVMVLVLWGFSRAFDSVSRRAFEELQQAHHAKSTFLATISHEIHTPMNGVLGLAEAMLAEPQPPQQKDNLLLIQRSGKLMVALINDLLDMTKAEAGKLTIDEHDFDLRRVLDDTIALFEPAAHKKGLALRTVVTDDVPLALRGDGLRLTQVLTNLVSNAVKFTSSGEVVLRVRSVGPLALEFEVRDTGIGIEPAMRSRLFTAFEQADGSTTRRFGGSGLGLALAQQLVTLMGGTIEVDSTQGQGSRFFFTIHFEPSSRSLIELTPPGGTPMMKLASQTVLVVDDNPINLAVAAQLVEKAGFRAVRAASGPDAISRLRSGLKVDLVLMDCHMPEMDGFEATRRIRAMEGSAGLPIVALTASTLPEDIEACRTSGMNDVMIKPVSLATLTTMLHRYTAAAA